MSTSTEKTTGPLSVNDWPALSTSPYGRGSNLPHKGQRPVVSNTNINLPPGRPISNGHKHAPLNAPSGLTPATTFLGPPPGLPYNVYPQHFPNHHQQYVQHQQYQQPPSQYIQHQHNTMYNTFAPPVQHPIVAASPAVNGPMSRAIPIRQPFESSIQPHLLQQTLLQPVPHSNFLPRPPPGLLHRRVTPTSRCQAQSVVPSASRPTISPSHTASSASIRDERSTTMSSSPTTVSSPPAPLKGKMDDLEGPLDKYAATYVPSWLRDVNQDTQFTLIPLPEEPNYDYDAFVSDFLPRSLIFSDPDEDVLITGKSNHSEKHDLSSAKEDDEIDLVKADSTWLGEGDEGLLEELEVPGDSPKGDGMAESPHASIGALSQQNDVGESLKLRSSNATVMQDVSEIRPSAPLPPFRLDTYSSRLGQLLEVEFAHRRDMLAAQSLYDTQLSVFPESKDSTSWSKDHLYSLRLPGVREDYPNLVTGDLLQLRVLASKSDTWLRIAFEAKVYVVHKVAGNVIIKCDGLAGHLKDLFTGVKAARFNILFTSSAFRGSTETINGVKRIGKHLRRPESTTGRVLQRWLFPSSGDEEAAEDASPLSKSLNWYDVKLNVEQKNVARAITLHPNRKIPFLIHGPPGTGKTKTLTETTLQILQHHPHSRILLTAPSVTAADTLALRLAPHLSPREMTRINDPRRTFEEVPEALLIYCTVEESSNGSARFGLPDWKKLIQTKIVIVASHDMHILHLCKVSNLELGRWQGITISTMFGEAAPPAKLHWTHLLVDEAGQSSEAEMANALLMVAPSSYHDETQALPVVVLCGDIAQLGPQIDSHFARSHGLDISLLERLSKRKVYYKQLKVLRAKARQILLRGDYGAGKMSEDSRLTGSLASSAAHLVRNYRARNASLLHVVSMLFYDDCLLPCAPSSTLDLSRWSFPSPQIPLLFEHISSKDEWVDEGASFYNTEEIEKVLELCKSLTSKGSGLVSAKDIAVITPYREQVWRIRLKLRKAGLGSISVGNVEVYQGAEHKVTIISTVRSSSRFLETDAKRSLGLVYERKRLCVALSRAQEALIVVGNADLLRLDPYWRSFIAYARRNLALRGEISEAQDEDGDQVGALEYAARTNGTPSEKDTAYLAGRMAASALYEDDEEDDEDEVGC